MTAEETVAALRAEIQLLRRIVRLVCYGILSEDDDFETMYRRYQQGGKRIELYQLLAEHYQRFGGI